MIAIAVQITFALLVGAILLNFYRLLRGPHTLDRVVSLDTMYVNAIGLIVLAGITWQTQHYFEAALLIAMMGFVGTVALCKFLLRGNVID